MASVCAAGRADPRPRWLGSAASTSTASFPAPSSNFQKRHRPQTVRGLLALCIGLVLLLAFTPPAAAEREQRLDDATRRQAEEVGRQAAYDFAKHASSANRRVNLKEVKKPTVEVISLAEFRHMRSGHMKFHEVHEQFLKPIGLEDHFQKVREEAIAAKEAAKAKASSASSASSAANREAGEIRPQRSLAELDEDEYEQQHEEDGDHARMDDMGEALLAETNHTWGDKVCAPVADNSKPVKDGSCECKDGQSVYCRDANLGKQFAVSTIKNDWRCQGTQKATCRKSAECGIIYGAEGQSSEKVPNCKCKSSSAQVRCMDKVILKGARKFNFNEAFKACPNHHLYCEDEVRCDQLVTGATWRKLHSGCKCPNDKDVVLCDGKWATNAPFQKTETNITSCAVQPKCGPFPRSNVAVKVDSSEEGSNAVTPPPKINPSTISKTVCVQFDVDLTVIAGVPLLISLALKGSTHMIPATHCYGWELDIFMQFSFGFTIGDLNFRIGVVLIASLVVSERPLNAAKEELMWELGYNYDTSICHTESPWDMMRDTMVQGFSFWKTHVWSNDYLEHPELKIKNELEKQKKSLEDFNTYQTLLKPKGNAFEAWQQHGTVDFGDAQSLVKSSQGKVRFQGLLSSDNRLEVTVKMDAKTYDLCSAVLNPTKLIIKVWQDIGSVVRSEQSRDFNVAVDPLEPRKESFFVSTQKGAKKIVVEAQLLDASETPLCSAPVVLNQNTEAGESTFDFDAGVTFLVKPETSVTEGAASNTTANQQDIVAVNSFGLTMKSKEERCQKLKWDHAELSIQTDSKADLWTEAYWTSDMFGTSAPWGVKVSRNKFVDKVNEKSGGLPQEARDQKVVDTTKPILSLKTREWEQVQKFLLAGVKASKVWSELWNAFLDKLLMEVFAKPTTVSAAYIQRGLLRDYLFQVLHKHREYLSKLAPGKENAKSWLLSRLADDVSGEELACVEVATADRSKGTAALSKRILDCSSDSGATHNKAKGTAGELDDVEIPDHLDGTVPADPSKMKWRRFERRSINTAACHEVQPSEVAESMDTCEKMCKELTVFDEDSGTNEKCNVARMDTDTLLCYFFKCTSFKSFPHRDGFAISAPVPEDKPKRQSPAEVVASLKPDVLRELIEDFTQSEIAQAMGGLDMFENAGKLYQQVVVGGVFDAENRRLSLSKLHWEAVNPVVSNAMYRDLRWLSREVLSEIMDVQKTSSKDANAKLKIYFKGKKVPATLDFKYDEGMRSRKGRRYNRKYDVAIANGEHLGCTVLADIDWMYDPSQDVKYFSMLQLVPVGQSMFAAYDSFSGKLPAYIDQVLDRLEPKDPKSWYDVSGLWQTLPYSKTDGRFLHRNLKTDEADTLKVHAGDLGKNDAVFNYPKAFEDSKYKDSPVFIYNAGLSIANLFVRLLGDVQSLFNIYFAGHPDWDGQCTSLPAKFNLFFEGDLDVIDKRASNWGAGRMQPGSGENPSRPGSRAPKFYSNKTVGTKGRALTDDEKEAWLGVHWIAKAKRLWSKDKRAAFMSTTAPVHGKDGWATENPLDLSAEMWPHIWCELVNQYWVEEDVTIATEQFTKSAGDLSQDLDHFMTTDTEQPDTFSFKKEILKIQGAVTTPIEGCPNNLVSKNFGDDIVKRLLTLGKLWATVLGVSKKTLSFYSNDILKVLEEDTYQVFEADPEDRTGEGDQSEPADRKEPKIDKDADPNAAPVKDAKAEWDTQVQHVKESITDTQTKTKEKSSMMERMYAALKLTAEAAGGGDISQDKVTRARYDYQSNKVDVEGTIREVELTTANAKEQLARLLNEYEQKAVLGERTEAQKWVKSVKEGLGFTDPLARSVLHLHNRLVAEFHVLFTCVEMAMRPPSKGNDMYHPKVAQTRSSRKTMLLDLRTKMALDDQTMGVEGVEFFFDKHCEVPLEDPEPDSKKKKTDKPKPQLHMRPECEKVIIKKALVTLFPSFVLDAFDMKQKLYKKLEMLVDDRKMSTVNEMLTMVKEYVKALGTGMDEDIFTGFAYRLDGALYGELWRALPDSTVKIQSTLLERKEGRKTWIKESIQYEKELQSHRRARVKNPEPETPDIPALAEGCICQKEWSVRVWKGLWPWGKKRFQGCVLPKEVGKKLGKEDMSDWKGVCESKQRAKDLSRCTRKYVPCDPKAGPDTRPQYRIWRKGALLDHGVYLPLIQTDFYMHVDVRGSRGDYCTPNMAPFKLDLDWYWSSNNWVPWALKRSFCWGGRIHPPGASISIMKCTHRGGAGSKDEDSVNLREIQVTATLYLVSSRNVWGTSDGDSMNSWFSGSWSSSWADKGWLSTNSGKVFSTNTWAQKDAGFGYLQTDEVVASGAGFWIALVAEAIAAFALIRAQQAVTASGEEETNPNKAWVVAAASVVWDLLKKYGRIPTSWSLEVAASTMAKALSSITGLTVSPFRNEFDLVLTARWTRISKPQVRSYQDLLPYLSHEQMSTTMQAAELAGVKMSQLWYNYQQDVDMKASNVVNLDRYTMINVLLEWFKNKPGGGSLLANVETVLMGCPGAPQQYKVMATGLKVFAFWRKGFSAWMQPPLKEGDTLFLTAHGDDWMEEIMHESESSRYFPASYKKMGHLKVIAVPERMPADRSKKMMPIDAEFFKRLLWRADIEVLRCWMRSILIRDKDIKPILTKYVKNGCDAPSESWKASGAGASAAQPYCFSGRYFSNFLNKNWQEITGIMGKDKKIAQNFAAIWHRGESSKIKQDKGQLAEKITFKKSSLAASLTVLVRLGLPFIKVPQILQIQPYFQLSMAYNVQTIIAAVKARLPVNFTVYGKKFAVQKTEMEEFKERINRCKKCVRSKKAFCDQQWVAKAMLTEDLISEVDACMDKTLEDAKKCYRFQLPDGIKMKTGSIYKKEICPCFDAVSGDPIRPEWITTESHCEEMRVPGEGEELRRATKQNDWALGFHGQGSTTKKMMLGNTLDYSKSLKGCQAGFRCCGSIAGGVEKLRCIKIKSLQKSGGLLASTFKVGKCKYFKPSNTTGSEWAHVKEEYRCSPTDPANSPFDGHWALDDTGKKWAKVQKAGA